MARKIQQVHYFHLTVRDRPGEAYRLLEWLSASGVNLLAFNAVPAGVEQTQLVLFPEDADLMSEVAAARGLKLFGPHEAIFVRGDDELGALTEIHRRLFNAGVNVSSSSGVADARGGFGYVIYFRDDEVAKAAEALDL